MATRTLLMFMGTRILNVDLNLIRLFLNLGIMIGKKDMYFSSQ